VWYAIAKTKFDNNTCVSSVFCHLKGKSRYKKIVWWIRCWSRCH